MKQKVSVVVFTALLIFSMTTVYAHQNETDFDDKELPLYVVALLALASGWLPLLAGYLSYIFFLRVYPKESWESEKSYISDGLSIGVLIFLMFDYLSLSSFLGIQELGISTIFVILSAAVVFIGMLYVANDSEYNWETIYLLWAVGLGFHSLSEGIIMGFNLTQGLAPSLKFFPISSFLIHKFAEGFTGAALVLKGKHVDIRKLFLYSVIAGMTIVIGVLMGYGIGDTVGKNITYLYAASIGSVLFIFPVFSSTHEKKKYGYTAFIGVGFAIMLIGTILHEL